jgi:phosphonate transport system substrate-binding protein
MRQGKTPAIATSLLLVAGMCLAADWVAAAASPALSPSAAPQDNGILSVGTISRAPKKEVAAIQSFADYLARRLAVVGITRGRIVMAGSMAEMADLMKRKQVDLLIDGPLSVAVVSMRSGAQPFLRRWRRGLAEYRSLVVARKDSGAVTVHDLKGRMIAFDAPFSTSGYLLPKATLVQAGLRLRKYTDASAKIPPGEIGYIFAHDEENIMFWVLRGKVPAGAMSNEQFDLLAGGRRNELRILMQTMSVPREAVAHRPDLPTRVLIALEEALLGMDANDEGKQVLERFDNTAKFDRFPQGATQAFRPIEASVRLLEPDLDE